MAADATEVCEEGASGGDLRCIQLAGGRRRSLRQHRGDVRRLLRRVGPGQGLGHERAGAERLRVMDPFREEVRVEAAAEVRQHRRVLAKFRHARPLGRELGGVGVAGRAVQLGEKQATFAQTGGGKFRGRRIVGEHGRRDGLRQEVLGCPGDPDESVALLGRGELGDQFVATLVQGDRPRGRPVQQGLAVQAELEAAGAFRREGERPPDRRLDLAFPASHERSRRKEGSRGLAGRHVQGEQAIGADVRAAAGDEGHGEAGLPFGVHGGQQKQGGKQGEEATHGVDLIYSALSPAGGKRTTSRPGGVAGPAGRLGVGLTWRSCGSPSPSAQAPR